MKVVYYILIFTFGGLVLLLLILYTFRFFRKQYTSINGKKIEEQIDIKNSVDNILKQISFYSREQDYRSSVIYLFYYLRMESEKKFVIRNAKEIDYQKFLFLLRGIPNLNLSDITTLKEIYKTARFTKKTITYEDYLKMKKIIEKLIM